jgi:hypothetical protein
MANADLHVEETRRAVELAKGMRLVPEPVLGDRDPADPHKPVEGRTPSEVLRPFIAREVGVQRANKRLQKIRLVQRKVESAFVRIGNRQSQQEPLREGIPDPSAA